MASKMRVRPEAIADSIMLKVDEMLTGLRPDERRAVVRVLDEVSRIRIGAKETRP